MVTASATPGRRLGRALAVAAALATTVSTGADAACFGLVENVFHDMHDGDMKQVAANLDNTFQINPYNNTQTWTVQGHFDENCVGIVDFNVPGKPNPPPVNLTMTLWIMGSTDNKLTKLGLEFTDPSGTLAPPAQPLNFWVLDKWQNPPQSPVKAPREHGNGSESCLQIPFFQQLVVDDMHDGDKKALKLSGNSLHISPYDNKQSWSVEADFNDECIANVNFDVPGKPNPPPVPLDARVWGLESIAGASKNSLLFTDPSGTIASPRTPLNVWTPNNKE